MTQRCHWYCRTHAGQTPHLGFNMLGMQLVATQARFHGGLHRFLRMLAQQLQDADKMASPGSVAMPLFQPLTQPGERLG